MSNFHLRENIYLIGNFANQLTGSKLPSNKEVLKVLFFNMRCVKMNLRESMRLVVQEVFVYWEKARIPVREKQHCIQKVKQLYEEWRSMQSHSSRTGPKQEQKVSVYIKKLESLFDIAHANALEIIRIEEDKLFLINQRKEGRPGSMCGIDYYLARKEQKRDELQEHMLNRKRRCVREMDQLNKTVTLENSSNSDSSFIIDSHQINDNAELAEISPAVQKKRGQIDILTPKLAAALDVCKMSDRNAVRVLAAAIEALGHDMGDFILNKNSIHTSREKMRSARVITLKNDIKIDELGSVCLHWDGKLLPALTGKEKVDRLPIIISSGVKDHLLEVPALNSGTGREQATAICNAIFEWGIQDNVQALVFDTTAVNTGRFNGTCSIIENTMERELLYLPCRHHIFEIMLKSVFDAKMKKSEGPSVQLFQEFQKHWTKINVKNYRIGLENEIVKKHLPDVEKDKIVKFLYATLQENQPREDYREFLELALIFLGQKPRRGINFRYPGAMHHARWMSKAIYTLKIYLFRFEFKLTTEQESSVCYICLFIVKIYIEAWFTATYPVKAPFNDFICLSKLEQFKTVDSDISRVALSKFKNHLWYLGSENVALAFFDSSVSAAAKTKMVAALNKEVVLVDSCHRKRAMIDASKISQIIENGIEQFICNDSKKFFQRFEINTDFMKTNPLTWPDNRYFTEALKIVSQLRVVNDTAERGVQLIQEFNSLLTKKEHQKQYLLKIVLDYRRRFPDSTKQTLSQQLD